MAGAGKKTFTAGEVLTASDVNTYLMEQSVMVFGGTAARSSAIPTPSEGMVSYRTDVNGIDYYNGSAWVGANGLVHINTTSFTAQSTVSINNVFTADYDNYTIIFNQTAVSSGGQNIYFRLRASGTDNTAGYYWAYRGIDGGGASSDTVAANTSYWNTAILSSSNGQWGDFVMQISTPFGAVQTAQNIQMNGWDGGSLVSRMGSGWHTASTSYDGFSLIASGGTFTGTVRVYGLRNS